MAVFHAPSEMPAADIRSLIMNSSDRIETARQAVREIEEEIARQRGCLAGQENREAGNRRTRDRLQEDIRLWTLRAEQAHQVTDTREEKRAEQKLQSLTRSLQEAEEKWWEASKAAEPTRLVLARLEDQAQVARRQKDSLLTVERRERPSSEFIALPESSHSFLCQPPTSLRIDEELEGIRKREGNSEN